MKAALLSITLGLVFLSPSALAVGYPEIWYPVFFPHDESDDQGRIETRKLLFAPRFSHPEYIGDALSAKYVLPNNDKSPVSKDINVISSHQIRVTTHVAEGGWKGKRVGVALVVDLRSYTRPEYHSPTDEGVLKAVAEAVVRTLYSKHCEARTVAVTSSPGQEALKKLLHGALKNEIAEQDSADHPATAPESKPEDTDKPQSDSEVRPR